MINFDKQGKNDKTVTFDVEENNENIVKYDMIEKNDDKVIEKSDKYKKVEAKNISIDNLDVKLIARLLIAIVIVILAIVFTIWALMSENGEQI